VTSGLKSYWAWSIRPIKQEQPFASAPFYSPNSASCMKTTNIPTRPRNKNPMSMIPNSPAAPKHPAKFSLGRFTAAS
jgi:hypothetical protein